MMSTTSDQMSQVDAFWRDFVGRAGAWQRLSIRDQVEQMNPVARKYFANIVLEVFDQKERGTPGLCISANGSIKEFPLVQELLARAPRLDGYDLHAFRKRTPGTNWTIGMDDFELKIADVLIGHCHDGIQVGLEIRFACAIPEACRDPARHMAFIMLDHIIGEYDFAVKVGFVRFVEAWSDSVQGVNSLAEFPPVFDRFWTQDLGHTGLFPIGEAGRSMLDVTFHADEATGRPAGKATVIVNDGATALAMRADLSRAVTVTVAVADEDELDRAQEGQEQIDHMLARSQGGILAYTMLRRGTRQAVYYVGDVAATRALIQQILPPGVFSIEDEYDVTWSRYRQFMRGKVAVRAPGGNA
jgi:hypothetical protein